MSAANLAKEAYFRCIYHLLQRSTSHVEQACKIIQRLPYLAMYSYELGHSTILHAACRIGPSAMPLIKHVVSEYPVAFNIQDVNGNIPVHIAHGHGHRAIAAIIEKYTSNFVLQEGAAFKISPTLKSEGNVDTIFIDGIRQKNMLMVNTALAQGANPHFRDPDTKCCAIHEVKCH